MKTAIFLPCVFALGVALSEPAAAQVATLTTGVQTVPAATGLASIPPEPQLFGKLTFGKFTFAPTLRVSEVGFDTNAFSLDGAERLPADFTATIDPGVEVRLETKRAGFRLVGTGGLVYYHENEHLRSVNPAGELGGFFRIGRKLELFGEAGGGRIREGLRYEYAIRPSSDNRYYEAGARVMGRRLGWEAAVRHREQKYDADTRYLGVQLSETLDRATQSALLALSYRFTPYTTVALGAAALTDRFPRSTDRDTAVQRVYGTVGFHPKAVIGGSIGIGYVFSDPLKSDRPGYSGITANVGVSSTWRDSTFVALGAARDFDISYRQDHHYYRYDVYEGSIRQALFRRFDIGAGVIYWTSSYPELGDALDLPTEVFWEISGSFGVRVTRKVRVGVYVRESERGNIRQPHRTYRSGLEATIGRINLNERGVFLHGVSR
jgi:hypothetical protein